MRYQRVLGLLPGGWTSRRFKRRGLTLGIKKLISIALCVFLLAPNITHSIAYATEIVIDGKTETVVTAKDAGVTDITTETVVNKNAFNSFERFSISPGETVNLMVPSNADNLLNLVHGSRSGSSPD